MACETAAKAAGKDYYLSETDPSYPSGCYLGQRFDGFVFNADAVGAGVRGTQLLCSGTANLARPAQSTIGYSRGTHAVLSGTHRATQGARLLCSRAARLARPA